MSRYLYIVDDDQAVRDSLCRLIARQVDCEIRCFASGDAFLAVEEALAPGVLLLDFHMQGRNGLATLSALKDKAASFVIVMLTAHGAVDRSVAAMKAGAHDFLEKPYDAAALLECLEAAFAELDLSYARNTFRNTAVERLARLSRRQTHVMQGMVTGLSNKEIARLHNISPRTVEIYRAQVMEKLCARTLSQVLHMACVAELACAA
jgi:two-component system response regulator FixJ